MADIQDDSLQELRLKYPPIVVEDTRIPTLSYDENEPRLIISEIVNENFKSYGGIRHLGPFHKNFTCIIGPNGSGKSNVIDALLFVFGFRASKIRSKKLSVLIHKSELFPNVQSCTVKVYFQRIIPTGAGDNDFEVVANSEFVVSRTAYKDNSNVYKINDKKAGTKEVADFLRKQGIDLDHNRFLILQGEVEQISLMKPKATTEYDDGLLEYLEDIIGSNRFKNPISLLSKRSEELSDLRMEKLNRVKVVEKEKKDLEGVRNDALRYLRLCNEITIRKNVLFQIKCRDFLLLENKAKEVVDECKNEMKGILEVIDKINALKIKKETYVQEIAKQHMIKIEEFETSKKRFKDLEIEDAALRDSRKHCKSKLDETKKLIKSKEAELAKYENVPEESVLRIDQLTKEISELDKIKQKEVANQDKAQVDLKVETMGPQKILDEKAINLRKEEELLTIQEKKIKSIKCERDILLSNYTKEEEKLARLESSLKSLKENVRRDKDILRRLEDEMPKMENDLAALSKELLQSRQVFKTVQAEIQEIQQQLDSGSSFEVEEHTIKFLFEQQSLGNLKNVVGRLGDLASVDPKYDVALSTACGRLDSIITETIDDAQHCVELMKKHRINKAAFIAMDKVNHWGSMADKPVNSPFNTPRAFDLLNIADRRYRAVFYFSFQNLLVALDISFARKINNNSQKKFRIVTLRGDLIEVSGAMTGGGNRVIRGKISTSSDKVVAAAAKRDQMNNVNRPELEQKLKEKKYKYDQLLQLIAKKSQQSDELVRNIEEGQRQTKNCEDQLGPSVAQESSLTEEIARVNENIKALKPNNAQVAQLDKLLKQLNTVYDNDSAKVELMRKDMNKLKDDITNTGIAKLSCIRSRLDSVLEKIKEKTDILKKISMTVKTAEKICTRTTVALEELSVQKTKLEQNLIDMDQTLKDLDIRASNNIQEYEKTNLEAAELEKIKEAKEKELSETSEEFKKLDCSRKQMQRAIEEKQEKLNCATRNLNQAQGQIEKLKLYAIPDEGEELDTKSFVDILGKDSEDMIFYSSQTNLHNGQNLQTYSDNELNQFNVQKMGFQDLEDKVNKQKPNLMAIEEYRIKEELYMQRAAELTEVTKLRDEQRKQEEQLKKQRLEEFLAGFNLITGKLKEMYQLITMGGDAELELVDTLNPFSEGIVFSVRPPKKSWKNITNLSGGEKTLSSLALVFALHHFKPTPFYVMDEIDAALDFKNVSIVANYIKQRTRNAQFIIISLRNNMYELSDRLVGIYKPFNFSKTCVLNPKSLEKCLSAHSNVLEDHVGQMFRLGSGAAKSQPPQSTQVTVIANSNEGE